MPGFTDMADDGIMVAVVSGKGGAGKTLAAVNLACAAGQSVYIDCDVEAPNGHLFLKPEIEKSRAVTVKIPCVDENLCNGCRACAALCKFNALAVVNGKPLVFEQVCHSCGGCALICPQKAVSEKEKTIGRVMEGYSGSVCVASGVLNVGETSGVPVIRWLLDVKREKNRPVFVDCPPGSACSVMESIKGADYCILVAEATLFGAHDLSMVYELTQLFGKRCGVLLNKCLPDDNPAEKFCEENGIAILGRLVFDVELANLCAEGRIAVRENPRFAQAFGNVLEKVLREAQHEATADSQR